MGTATFTWSPDYQAQDQRKPNVAVASMGDGYEQRVRFGINTDRQVWSLRFENRDSIEGPAIAGFLKDRGAWDSFFWTPPSEPLPLKFKCAQWSRMPVKGTGLASDGSLQAFWTIDATFTQVFEP